ncbi:hypothetical protein PM10SUCC1_22300 [Propionigenium maris DSM 9537]|uniref:RHS repeat-associated core domain-containing protein n=1 Tax=Propionigenium maris DSM 9537 TaxID=1123000 RepID=A0A9W6LMV6_9FUSO|nr:RHS repeat-associated core domain-containing protein [Propionigenium maris]GLI56716.1 hypothetical protein PM10SUCC1_22300 [Propionigenium maris DSM 9537]
MKYVNGLGRLPLVEIDETGNTRINIFDESGMVGVMEGNKVNYLLKDHLGSTRVAADEYGEKRGELNYSDFGETTTSGEVGNIRYRYTGEEWDEEVEEYNYLAREYDPATGRFNSPDPAREGFSPYVYVGNNPINFVDSDGKVRVRYLINKKGVSFEMQDRKQIESSVLNIESTVSGLLTNELSSFENEKFKTTSKEVFGSDTPDTLRRVQEGFEIINRYLNENVVTFKPTDRPNAEAYVRKNMDEVIRVNMSNVGPVSLEYTIFHELTHLELKTVDVRLEGVGRATSGYAVPFAQGEFKEKKLFFSKKHTPLDNAGNWEEFYVKIRL